MAVIIGIAGGTGSGKTTLTNKLKEKLGTRAAVICHDSYYKRTDETDISKRSRINYDSPDAFDTKLLTEHINELKNGNCINCPVYDYAQHNRTDRTVLIKPAPVIVIEGILVLQSRELRELMDLKIFVDADADERVLRRLSRDISQRGRTVEDIMEQYRKTVKPMHDKYVEPSKRFADIVVISGENTDTAVEMICAWTNCKDTACAQIGHRR